MHCSEPHSRSVAPNLLDCRDPTSEFGLVLVSSGEALPQYGGAGAPRTLEERATGTSVPGGGSTKISRAKFLPSKLFAARWL